jgi:hypothetical protein
VNTAASSSIAHAVVGIRSWGEAREWRGYDPYDALNSPIAGLVPGRIGRRLLTQAVKLSPLNLRPLLRIEPAWNQKAIGLVASGYARLGLEAEADRWLGWLAESHVGDGGATAWGYHFPVETRFFAYARNTPNTIATSFVAHAFLDAHEYFGDRRSADVARATATYLERHMLAEGPSGPFFRYLPGEDAVIHNANALACAVLARTARLVGEHAWLEPARSALQTTLAAQRNDGSWPYAVGAHGWVDNFHTGYVLESLARFPEARRQLERGLRYWERAFFLADGTPKFFAERVFPIDAHCYAQAIETWLAVGDLERAERAAELLIRRMVDPSGYVHFQQRRLWTNKVPLVRWTTAPSFRALAGILRARGERGSEP